MKVNSNRDITFKSIYTNTALKKGLELAGSNGALFGASATLALSMFIRPLSIWSAPHADKENKKIACAKSIASSISQFGLTYAIAKPITGAIEKINETPEKYLSKDSIKRYQSSKKHLVDSKSYELATQLFKLGVGFLVAIPKGVLTVACLPFVLKHLFHSKKSEEENSPSKSELSFRGKERFTKGIGSILNKKGMQNFSERFKDSNFAMHIVAMIDALTTGAFIFQTNRSDKIKEDRKKALIYNAGFSTALSIGTSYILDKLTEKPTQKFVEKFKLANKNDPNLEKQLRGLKIAKPMIILGGVYYMLIPFLSTILAEIADKNPRFDIGKTRIQSSTESDKRINY